MSFTPTIRTSATLRTSPVAAATGLLATLGRWYITRRRRRIGIRQLRALDDRLLRDIGIGRSEIESASTIEFAGRPKRYNDYGPFRGGNWS